MEFPYIEKHLGKDWLQNEMQKPEYHKYGDIGVKVLAKIDELINKLEHLKGFSKWAVQASTSASFADFLFELMVLQHLHKNADQIEMKPDKPQGVPVPEAEIIKNGYKILMEAKRIDGIPPNIRAKVSRLFTKIREQFGESAGIAFIECPDFFTHNHEKIIPKLEFGTLIVEIERRLMNPNSDRSIKAVFLTNVTVIFNPKLNEVFVGKRFFLVRRPEDKGGISEDKLQALIEADGVVEVQPEFFNSGM